MSLGLSTTPAVRGCGFEVNLPASFTENLSGPVRVLQFLHLCSLFENVLTRCREGQNSDKK